MVAESVPTHPILTCARTLERELSAVAEMPADYLRTRDKEDLLVSLARVKAEVAELELRVLATASDVAEEHGARDAGTWYAHATHTAGPTARADLHLAQSLLAHPLTGDAMRAGSVNPAQARVIIRAVDKLSDAVDELTRVRAEKHLIDLAGTYDARDLAVLGTKILEVVAPHIAEAELGKQLEREEQAARDKCSVKLRPQGDGATRITALVPDSIAERLTTYLDAEDSPRVSTSSTSATSSTSESGSTSATSSTSERGPRSRSRGEAFCRLIEHLDPTRLPDHGGDATTVMVTIAYDALTSQVGSAMLGGTPISASEARRLACTAKIIPTVLGGKSEILDLGRARRLYTPPQRKAMRLRDKRCRAEDCTIPAAWCEAHHLKPWSQGGNTDLADGVLLCTHHHHRAHDTRYEMTKLASGDYRFHRRT